MTNIPDAAKPVAELSLNAEQEQQLLQDILGRDYVYDDYDEAWVAVDENFSTELGRRYIYVKREDWSWGRVVISKAEVQ